MAKNNREAFVKAMMFKASFMGVRAKPVKETLSAIREYRKKNPGAKLPGYLKDGNYEKALAKRRSIKSAVKGLYPIEGGGTRYHRAPSREKMKDYPKKWKALVKKYGKNSREARMFLNQFKKDLRLAKAGGYFSNNANGKFISKAVKAISRISNGGKTASLGKGMAMSNKTITIKMPKTVSSPTSGKANKIAGAGAVGQKASKG